MQDVSRSQPEPARAQDTEETSALNRHQWLLWVVFVAAMVSMILALGAKRPAGDAVAWEYDMQAAVAAAQETGRPLMLTFSAEWCGACKIMDAGVFSEPTVKRRLEREFVSVKVDVTNADSPGTSVAEQYDIQVLPTTLVLDHRGEVVGRKVGSARVAEFHDWLDQMQQSCDRRR